MAAEEKPWTQGDPLYQGLEKKGISADAPLPPHLQPMVPSQDLMGLELAATKAHVADIITAVSCPLCGRLAKQPCAEIPPGYVHKARWQLHQDQMKQVKASAPEGGTGAPVYAVACPTCGSAAYKKCRDAKKGWIVKPHHGRMVAAGLATKIDIEQVACPACGYHGPHLLEMVVHKRRYFLGHRVGDHQRVVFGPLLAVGTQDDTSTVHCGSCQGLLEGYGPTSKQLLLESQEELDQLQIIHPVDAEEL